MKFLLKKGKTKSIIKYDSFSTSLPEIVEKTIEHLTKNGGLELEGIFRVPGNHEKIRKAKNAFDKGKPVLFSKLTLHDTAGVLKLFFIELPEPLLTFDLYDAMVACLEGKVVEVKLSKLRVALGLLPPLNRIILNTLMEFLYEISKKSDINKMTEKNLSLIFGSHLLRSKSCNSQVTQENLAAYLISTNKANEIITLFFKYYDLLFVHPDKPIILSASSTKTATPAAPTAPPTATTTTAATTTTLTTTFAPAPTPAPTVHGPTSTSSHDSHGPHDSHASALSPDGKQDPNMSIKFQKKVKRATLNLATTLLKEAEEIAISGTTADVSVNVGEHQEKTEAHESGVEIQGRSQLIEVLLKQQGEVGHVGDSTINKHASQDEEQLQQQIEQWLLDFKQKGDFTLNLSVAAKRINRRQNKVDPEVAYDMNAAQDPLDSPKSPGAAPDEEEEKEEKEDEKEDENQDPEQVQKLATFIREGKMRDAKNYIKQTFEDGSTYEGSYDDDGNYHGYGRYVFADGNVYEGEFVHGKREGKGRLTFSNKDEYIGQFYRNERHGFGTYRDAKGNVYEGHYRMGERHGHGVFTYEGCKYEGEFRHGVPHGKGKFYFSSGDFYEGDFENNLMHGKGIYKDASGNSYEGDYQKGKRTGKGIFVNAKGNRYEGDFVDGVMHGHGLYYFADGDKYEGQFADGKFNGEGVYFFAAKGRSVKGKFKDGKPVKS